MNSSIRKHLRSLRQSFDLIRIILQGLSAGLFGLDKFRFAMNGDTFGDHVLATSLFILGCTTASCGLSEPALHFLDSFIDLYVQSEPRRKLEMLPALTIAKRIEKNIILRLAQRSYVDKAFAEMKRYADKVYLLDRNDYDANLLLSIAYELDGDREAAIRFNDVATRYAPSRLHTHLFNKAYFALSTGEYLEAVKIYDSIPTRAIMTINDIRVFFNDRYERTNEPAYLFGEGYVTFKWQSEREARRIMRDFMKSTRDASRSLKYTPLRMKAEEILIRKSPV